MLGNFPQAFSHVGFIISAANLCTSVASPSKLRSTRDHSTPESEATGARPRS